MEYVLLNLLSDLYMTEMKSCPSYIDARMITSCEENIFYFINLHYLVVIYLYSSYYICKHLESWRLDETLAS